MQVFPWSIMDVCCGVSYLSWMYAFLWVIPSSITNVFHNVSLIDDGFILLCFLDLWWLYTVVFPWSLMDVCFRISLIYHGYMPQWLLDLSWMYTMMFLWSVMGVYHSTVFLYHYTRCVPQFFPLLSWIYASINVSVV